MQFCPLPTELVLFCLPNLYIPLCKDIHVLQQPKISNTKQMLLNLLVKYQEDNKIGGRGHYVITSYLPINIHLNSIPKDLVTLLSNYLNQQNNTYYTDRILYVLNWFGVFGFSGFRYSDQTGNMNSSVGKNRRKKLITLERRLDKFVQTCPAFLRSDSNRYILLDESSELITLFPSLRRHKYVLRNKVGYLYTFTGFAASILSVLIHEDYLSHNLQFRDKLYYYEVFTQLVNDEVRRLGDFTYEAEDCVYDMDICKCEYPCRKTRREITLRSLARTMHENVDVVEEDEFLDDEIIILHEEERLVLARNIDKYKYIVVLVKMFKENGRVK